MQIIDNINHIVKNDLQDSIQPGSKLSIAAACFSIYAYQELKKQLEKQISVLENKMKKEKQLNRQMEMNAEMKRLCTYVCQEYNAVYYRQIAENSGS